MLSPPLSPFSSTPAPATAPVASSVEIQAEPKAPQQEDSSPRPHRHVPMLNLEPLLQTQLASHQSSCCYREALPAAEKTAAQLEPAEPFYFYKRIEAKEELKMVKMINGLPNWESRKGMKKDMRRDMRKEMMTVYCTMVSAEQRVEAETSKICRLLAAKASHQREQLNEAADRHAMIKGEIVAFQDKCEEQQALIQQMQGLIGAILHDYMK